MNTDFIKGVIVPILTPIDEEERIDEAKLRDQVNHAESIGELEAIIRNNGASSVDK